ncbi:hypothetical protein [Neotamlana nanhaiensis]|uniref:hypothetical protein n=1 Tax=Neotamlana nanhaiensis TaxID=1382798 RepID=UPI00069B62EB|nr:hypothetical protein [Tamlana nanhaiensis]
MKTIILNIFVIFCFISCNNESKYQGKWINSAVKPSRLNNESKSIIIENDSIKFNFPYFDYWHKYSLKIKNRELLFNDYSVKANVKKDTLTLNDSIFLVRNISDTSNWDKPLLKINLLNSIIPQALFKENSDNEIFLYFGQSLKTNSLSLRLNDSYAEINDIPQFVYNERASSRCELTPFYSATFFIDKTTPMKFVEDMLYQLKAVNLLKVNFVGKINLEYDDSLGFRYSYDILTKKLFPFIENDGYYTNSLKKISKVPPPPITLSLSDTIIPKTRIIYLKNNQIIHNNTTITTGHLKNLIKPWIEENDIIISLYDLNSNFNIFFEMNAIINNEYIDFRKSLAKQMFNKSLYELTDEEYFDIKLKHPMTHVWDFSIPHYNHIIRNNNSFFGLKVPLVDSASRAE